MLVQQPGAPPFYITSVPADELLEWCDVPRAKGDYMAGYQRTPQDKRVQDLANYLRLSPNNIIPGAVTVAVDPDYITITEMGDGVYTIAIGDDIRDFDTKLQELWGMFTTRLADEEAISAGIPFLAGSTALAAEETSGDETTDSTTEGIDEPIDLSGFAESVELADEIDDPSDEDDDEEVTIFPSSYLASLARELSAAVEGARELFEQVLEIRERILGHEHPETLIAREHLAGTLASARRLRWRTPNVRRHTRCIPASAR